MSLIEEQLKQYAQDMLESDKPWQWWDCNGSNQTDSPYYYQYWTPCLNHRDFLIAPARKRRSYKHDGDVRVEDMWFSGE